MTVEQTIIKAETVVIKAETSYVKELVDDIQEAEREGREGEHELLLAELIKEGKRTDSKGKFDEEEKIIRGWKKKP